MIQTEFTANAGRAVDSRKATVVAKPMDQQRDGRRRPGRFVVGQKGARPQIDDVNVGSDLCRSDRFVTGMEIQMIGIVRMVVPHQLVDRIQHSVKHPVS